MFKGWAGRDGLENLTGRKNVLLPPGKKSGDRFDRSVAPAFRRETRRREIRLLQPLEHVEVLPLDHRPGVVAAEELTAVAPEACVERTVRLERVERFDELLVALVVEPGVAADALSL